MASQRLPNKEKKSVESAGAGWVEWVPNVPHVFRQDQHLYFLYEVYDADQGQGRYGAGAATPGLPRRRTAAPVRVLTSIESCWAG